MQCSHTYKKITCKFSTYNFITISLQRHDQTFRVCIHTVHHFPHFPSCILSPHSTFNPIISSHNFHTLLLKAYIYHELRYILQAHMYNELQ